MKKFPEHLIFDFGGVLLDIDIQRSIAAFERLGITGAKKEDIHPDNTGLFLDLEKGDISTQEFIEGLQASALSETKPSEEQILDAWNELLLPYRWENFELIDALRQKGHKIHLLSNTNQPHHQYFEARFNREHPTGRTFRSFFDTIFYSDELRMRKPDREIYEHLWQEIGSPHPEEILFIDDNSPNLTEPKSLGWQTHHLVFPQRIKDFFAL